MFPEQLQKILQLAKQTGDRVIIYDSATQKDSYVVMNIDNYIDLIGLPKVKSEPALNDENAAFLKKNEVQINLTEEDLTDRINQEISMWKNQESNQSLDEEEKIKNSWQIPPAIKNKAHNIE